MLEFITLHVPENLYTTSGLSILMHGVISLKDAISYDKAVYKISQNIDRISYYILQIILDKTFIYKKIYQNKASI